MIKFFIILFVFCFSFHLKAEDSLLTLKQKLDRLQRDKIYGKSKINKFGKNKDTFNKFLILKNFSRQALHAYHLGFKHPKTKKYIEFNCELPKDIKDLLNFIVKY